MCDKGISVTDTPESFLSNKGKLLDSIHASLKCREQERLSSDLCTAGMAEGIKHIWSDAFPAIDQQPKACYQLVRKSWHVSEDRFIIKVAMRYVLSIITSIGYPLAIQTYSNIRASTMCRFYLTC